MRRNATDITKLKEECGVSLPIALFLFMICAILMAIVLAAASAALGQHANQAKAAQTYYSVSSAAEMLSELLNGQKVELTVTREYDRTTVTSIKEEHTASTDSEATYALYLDGNLVEDTDGLLNFENLTLLQSSTLDLLGLLGSSTTAEELWFSEFQLISNSVPTTLSLQHDMLSIPQGADEDAIEAALDIEVKESVNPDATIGFSLYEPSSQEEERYELNFSLDGDYYTTTATNESQPAVTQTTEQRQEVRHITETKTFSVTWSASPIQKVVSDNTP